MFRSVLDILDALSDIGRTRRQKSARQARARLGLDALEDRAVPALVLLTDIDAPEPPVYEAGPYTVGDSPQAVVSADFNGDGKLDLAVANFVSNTVSILLGAGDGSFAPATNYTTGSGPQSLAAGDLDGDGHVDLVTANSGGDISVLLGNGDGTFGSVQNISLEAVGENVAARSIAIGDLDGDETLDVVVTTQTSQTYEYYDWYYGYYTYTVAAGQVNVLVGDGTGHFATPITTQLGTWDGGGVAVADLNGDEVLDAVVANENESTVSVLIGVGDGTARFAPPVNYFTGWGPQAVAIDDFTNDGNVDLITVGQTVDVLPGFGDGTFEGMVPVYVDPVAVVTGDFNADGNLDAVVAHPTHGSNVLLGRGDGTFALPIDITSGSMPMGVATGDFNGDGRPDLAMANSGSDNVSVFINDGVWPELDAPTLSISDATVTEGHDGSTVNANFTVTLSRTYDRDVTIRYETADGGGYWYDSAAAAGSDYQATSGEVTIAAGQTTATISVAVNGDRVAENNEVLSVKLTRATNAFITDPLGLGNIIDDEPRINISDATVTEGNGTTSATFTVRLTGTSTEEIRVNFSTAEGDTEGWYYYDYYYGYYYYPPPAATSGTDFEAQSDTLVFAPGETEKTITVLVKGDRNTESNEAFSVNLSGASGALISDGHAVGTIIDDEPRLSVSSASITEGNSGTKIMTFTVSLAQAYDTAVTVNYATVAGSATAGSDYQATSGMLTFNPGETTKTVDVVINGDTTYEYYYEYFYLQLSNASSNATIDNAWGAGYIYDDDSSTSGGNGGNNGKGNGKKK